MGDDVTVSFESFAIKRDLGASLKAARLAMKPTLSTTRAAAALGISQASVSRIENGKQLVNKDQLCQMANVYKVRTGQLSQWLRMLTQVNAPDQWWHEEPYRKCLTKRYAELIGVEDAAEALMLLQLQVVPGLLQTAEYTRALLEGSPIRLSAEEIDSLIEVRQVRQQRLSLDAVRPLQATFILSQAVLEMRYSSEEVHRAQMRQLDLRAKQDNITIVILPFDRMIDLNSVDLYDLPGGADPVVFTEPLMTSQMVQTIDDVEKVRGIMLKAQQRALSPAQSQTAIRQRMDGSHYARQQ